MSYKLLILDDDPDDLESTKLILSDEADLEITATTDSAVAISEVKKSPNEIATVLVDFNMPGKNGLQVAKEMLAINPKLVIAILSMDESRDTLKKCIDSGVRKFIEKNQEEEVIRSQVRNLCQIWENTAQLFNYSSQVSNETGLIESIGLAGKAPTVFISGESGTGKELIANAIHKLSKRRLKPFIAINVNAIPDNLAESELFGHIKGAFTGADRAQEGKFLSAQGGTIFLDEIGDLKPELQVKLLRVIQERKVTPVGGAKPMDLDVRFVAATHVNIEKAISEGRFREDLYYRLYVIPIEVPPLRDRPEDIRPLIRRFLDLHGGGNHNLLEKTVRYLERYHWRGNVRELENEIERLISLTRGDIEPKHLSAKIKEYCGVEVGDLEAPDHKAFSQSLQQMEWDYLQDGIRRAGTIREACRSIFRVSNSTIHTRISILKEQLNLKSIRREHEENI
jgi:DNA-binding NtrC family response regulator